MSRADFSVRSS